MLAPIVGGNWNNSSNAGVWAMNVNNNRTNSNNNADSRSVIWGFNAARQSRGPKGLQACRARGALVRAVSFPAKYNHPPILVLSAPVHEGSV